MSPVETSSKLAVQSRLAFWSQVAGSVLMFAGLFLFAAQRWEITAASIWPFTLGVVVFWITSWRHGTMKKKRLLLRILVHVIVTTATFKAVFVGLLLIGLMLTGDNPALGSWGMKAVEWIDQWVWIICGAFGVVTNFTTWALFKFFSGEKQPNSERSDSPQRAAGPRLNKPA